MAQPPPPVQTVPIDDDNVQCTPLIPLVKLVECRAAPQPDYVPIWDINDHNNFHHAAFSESLGRRSSLLLDPTASAMVELYFTDELLEVMASRTRQYAASRLPPSRRIDVQPQHIAYFLAMYYYQGIVRLPNKKDYWRADHSFWPVHPPAQNISRDMYMYIWRNLHFLGAQDEEDEEDDIEEEEEYEMQEGLDPNETDNEEEEEEEEPEEEPEGLGWNADTVWYGKISMFLEHVLSVSRRLCIRPGSKVSIDEMMKRFKGRSGQTHRMKNKPIKEGYKFFALCNVETGFVWNMIPDGRLERSSTHDYVHLLAGTLPETDKYNYVIGMDNYFTWPRVMETLCDMGVGCVGTARYQRGWPPKEYRDIDDSRFNTVYLMNDKRNYRIIRWVDNNVVTMVSNVHNGNEVVNANRKRPRRTNTNRMHLDTVWGNDPVKRIIIPKPIDDCNHWMCGVDKADQLIAYY